MTKRTMQGISRRTFLGTAASAGAAAGVFTAGAAPAIAQAKPTVLKWAHVYEVSEPYHTEALWAAEEIKKRTNGKYEIQVFPASQLGNETQINEALGLGTVDIIYTGAAFAGAHPQADVDHQRALHSSATSITGRPIATRKLFREHRQGLRGQDRAQDRGAHLLRPAALTANKEIKKPEDMKGMKLRVPPAPLFLMFTEVGGRQRHADRLRRGLSGAAAGHRRRPGEPAAHHHGQEVLRGAEAHHADRPHHGVAADHRRHARVGKLTTTRRRSSTRC